MPSLTIADLTPTPFHAFSPDTNAQTARQAVAADAAILVQAADGRPLGVIPPQDVPQLSDPDRSLADYRPLWQPPTLVLPSTPVADVLRAMRYDKRIRWQVALQGPAAARLIAPDTLFAVSRNQAALQADQRLSAAVYGDPMTEPSGLCYLCTAEPAHAIPPEWVEDRTADGQALCPCDGSPMHGTFACPQEFRPC